VIPIPVETDVMLAILNLPKDMSNNGIFKEHQGLVMEMIHSLVLQEHYDRATHDAWKTEIKDAARLAIQMLSDMPRAEKINKESIDKLMSIINTQLGDRSLPWSMSPPRR